MSFNPAALDRQIEGDDRDDEPRDVCSECSGCEGDHAATCSYDQDYYEPRDEHDSPCDEPEAL